MVSVEPAFEMIECGICLCFAGVKQRDFDQGAESENGVLEFGVGSITAGCR